jgi:hypothetical protein
VRLYGIYEAERDAKDRSIEHDRVRRCASRMLQPVMPALASHHWKQVRGRRRGAVQVSELEEAAEFGGKCQDADDLLGQLENERSVCLKKWAERCPGQTGLQNPLAAASPALR